MHQGLESLLYQQIIASDILSYFFGCKFDLNASMKQILFKSSLLS